MSRRIRNHRVGNSSSKYDFDGGASLERDIAAKAERHYKNCEMIEEAIRQAKATPDEAKSYVVHVLESLYGMEGLRKADQYCDILRARNAALQEKIEAANKRADAAVEALSKTSDCKSCAEQCGVQESLRRKSLGRYCPKYRWRGVKGTEGER